MRKDGVDVRRYRQVHPFDVKVGETETTIEFRETYTKRVVLTFDDWQIQELVRLAAAVPKKRGQRLEEMRQAFDAACDEARRG